ncbi:MAG: response regulator transcription factor [Chloroflexi bacterium]|nr:response regulator transcription factor [Chloroflexota bacterium]
MESWRVILAESHPQLRQNMVKIISGMTELSLVAKVTNGWDVMFTSSQLKPDIVLLDFDLPGLSGIEVARLITRGLPDVRVVVLLDDGEEDDGHKKAIEQCGACGYLLKNGLARQLPAFLDNLEQAKRGNNSSNQKNAE